MFDPLRVTGSPRLWWVDLLAGLRTKEAATRLAAHFVLTVDDEHKRDIWGPAAKDLLCALFLAAATSGRTLREVDRWLGDAASPIPAELLDRAGFSGLASSLRGMQNGAPETRDGIYQTARTAAACLNDEEILPWVTPPRGRPLPVFDPLRFAGSRDTLYLITETGTAAAPLIAAMADAVMRAGRRRAERSGGRLDPPMTVILDEAANICRIADLPSQYSHAGGRGVIPVTILQSYEQGVTVWGEQGMASLWGAATKKLIGAGVDSPRLARDMATLVGQHDVPVQSRQLRRRPRERAGLAAPPGDPRSRRRPGLAAGHGTAVRHRGACRADPAAALVRRPGRRQDQRGQRAGGGRDPPRGT